MRRARAGAGRGRLHRHARGLPRALAELCDRHGILYVDDEVQSGVGRTGPVWAIEHYGVEPDLLVSGKSLGGGLPLAAVTGPRGADGRARSGGLGGTFGGNPVACAAACACSTRSRRPSSARAPTSSARGSARGSTSWRSAPQIGEVRGLGPMLALELVEDRESKRPAAELAKATSTARARARA